MPKYNVTVQVSGTKTYQYEAAHPDDAVFLFEQWSSLDHMTNPVEDSVTEEVIAVEEILKPEPVKDQTEHHLIEQALNLLQWFVKDGQNETDIYVCSVALEALDVLKKGATNERA